MSAPVNYVLLYRSKRQWRTTVRTPEELSCGALLSTGVSESFDVAAREFAAHLRTEWGVGEPISWQEIRPEWWGADLVPGALAAAGETPSSGSE